MSLLAAIMRHRTITWTNSLPQKVCQCRRNLLISLKSNVTQNRSSTHDSTQSTQSFLDISSFGKLIIQCSNAVNVHFTVKPVDPQACPDQNKASVTTDNNVLACSHVLESNVLTISEGGKPGNGQKKQTHCHVEVPIKFDIVTRLGGHSSLHLSSMENKSVDIEVEHGTCSMNNVQTGSFSIVGDTSDVLSEKLLQGNGSIQTSNGNVSIHKVLSNQLSVISKQGDVHITNLYANKSDIQTERGDVHIVNDHLDTSVTVIEKGNIKIDSVSGSLKAKTGDGNIDVTTSQHNLITLNNNKGDISITIPQSLTSHLEVKGDKVKVDETLALIEKNEQTTDGQTTLTAVCGEAGPSGAAMGRIVAQTGQGNIHIKSSTSNWISMVQDKFHSQ